MPMAFHLHGLQHRCATSRVTEPRLALAGPATGRSPSTPHLFTRLGRRIRARPATGRARESPWPGPNRAQGPAITLTPCFNA